MKTKPILIAAFIGITVAGCGTLIPADRQTSTAQKATDAFNSMNAQNLKSVRSTPTQPQPSPVSVTVSGKDNKLDLTVQKPPTPEPSIAAVGSGKTAPGMRFAVTPNGDGTFSIAQLNGETETLEYSSNTGQKSSSANDTSYLDSIHIPMFVKIIGGCIGVAMIFGLIWYARKNSVAANAAFSMADTEIAKGINIAEEKLKAATTDSERATHAQNLAGLEKSRGRIALHRKAKPIT